METILVAISIVIVIIVGIGLYIGNKENAAAKQFEHEQSVRRAQERTKSWEEKEKEVLPFHEFAWKNRALCELIYHQEDGSDEQRRTLEKIIEEYERFNQGKNFTTKDKALALNSIWQGAHNHVLRGLEKLTTDMQRDLLVN